MTVVVSVGWKAVVPCSWPCRARLGTRSANDIILNGEHSGWTLRTSSIDRFANIYSAVSLSLSPYILSKTQKHTPRIDPCVFVVCVCVMWVCDPYACVCDVCVMHSHLLIYPDSSLHPPLSPYPSLSLSLSLSPTPTGQLSKNHRNTESFLYVRTHGEWIASLLVISKPISNTLHQL